MSTTASAIVLVGRVLFVALFAFSARGHIVSHSRFVTMAKGRLPVPYVAGWPTGVWLLFAALLLVLGIWADIAALMMAAALFALLSVAGAGQFAITGPLLKLGSP